MPKFSVCLARETCEYGYIEVEAEDHDEAILKAYAQEGKIENWEPSDWAGTPYYPGPGNCTRLEDEVADDEDDIGGGYY